jgi:uncharacterized protein (DUF1501 family)
MLHRRTFLQGASLLAFGHLAPAFVSRTAEAAEPGKDRVLVLLEMTGGNDGLNTVIPFRDDLYHKARPTLGFTKDQVLRVNDDIGLNPSLAGLHNLLQKRQLAIVQGAGYPNPDRSHFESMDIWQSADPRRRTGSGWLGRGLDLMKVGEGKIPGICVGREQLPLALQGSATGAPALQHGRPFELHLGAEISSQANQFTVRRGRFINVTTEKKQADQSKAERRAERLRLIRDVADLSSAGDNDLHAFVRRSSLETYTTLDRLRDLLQAKGEGEEVPQPDLFPADDGAQLRNHLNLVAKLIRGGFGTRVFYVSIDGFDTHSSQRPSHVQLLALFSSAVSTFLK